MMVLIFSFVILPLAITASHAPQGASSKELLRRQSAIDTSRLPACHQNCLLETFPMGPNACSPTDLPCLCKSSSFVLDSAKCTLNHCSIEDQVIAYTLSKENCHAVSVDIDIQDPRTLNTKTNNSTASVASVNPSNATGSSTDSKGGTTLGTASNSTGSSLAGPRGGNPANSANSEASCTFASDYLLVVGFALAFFTS